MIQKQEKVKFRLGCHHSPLFFKPIVEFFVYPWCSYSVRTRWIPGWSGGTWSSEFMLCTNLNSACLRFPTTVQFLRMRLYMHPHRWISRDDAKAKSLQGFIFDCYLPIKPRKWWKQLFLVVVAKDVMRIGLRVSATRPRTGLLRFNDLLSRSATDTMFLFF